MAAVEAIYTAAPDPSLWPDALQAIANVFGDVGAILIWRRDDGAYGTIVSATLVAAQDDYVASGWATRELRALRTTERGFFFSGQPFTDRHICSDDEIRSDPVYTQFCARHGMGWFGGVAVSPDPRVGVALSVQRNARLRPPYSDDELAVVGRLGRHIEKSLRLSIQLLDAELSQLGLADALSRLRIGVFALDSSKRVVFSNPAGRKLLGDGLLLADERLQPAIASDRASFDAALDRMVGGAPADLARDPSPILIGRQKSDRPLSIYILPVLSRGLASDDFLTGVRAIALVIDPSSDEPADPAIVRDVLGLTLGEARVAALVGAGVTPREAAAKLGISEETARTTLKRAFAKAGVSRQSESAALLTKLVLR